MDFLSENNAGELQLLEHVVMCYNVNTANVRTVQINRESHMNMAPINRIAVGALMLGATALFCGCSGISENTRAYLGGPHFPPTNATNVQFFASEPGKSKDCLGEIFLSTSSSPSRQTLENRFKVAAARWGADGVFIVSDRTHVFPVVYWNIGGLTTDQAWNRSVVGVAFKSR
jgi:hypothetical protein